jgi:hypothetical protein
MAAKLASSISRDSDSGTNVATTPTLQPGLAGTGLGLLIIGRSIQRNRRNARLERSRRLRTDIDTGNSAQSGSKNQ